MTTIESRKNYFLKYTILFALIITTIFIEYIITGTTFVCAKDSLAQHYPYMLKVKEFYESLLLNLFSTHSVELVDYNAYFGLDVISSYNYYGLGNPLYILTIGWPMSLMPLIYSIIVIIKIYLAGIAFSFLCFSYKKAYFSTLLGTLMYILSPILIGSISQMIFLDVYYQLPLLIIGFNQILKGKKSPLFTVGITLVALNGFYFFYMITIILAIYGIVYVIRFNSELKSIFENVLKSLFSTSIHYLLGLMISAPTLLPTLISFFNSYRTSSISTTSFNLLYDLEHYLEQLTYIFFYSNSQIRINVVMLFIVLLLLTMRTHKYKSVKFILFLLILCAQIPLVGKIMNGLSYPSNRWLFCFYLYFAFVSVDIFEDFISHSPRKKFNHVILSSIFILTIFQTIYINHFYKVPHATSQEIETFISNTTVDILDTNDRLDGDTDWRYNTSTYHDISKTQFYISTLPKILLSSHLSFNLPTVDSTNEIQGLDSRTELEAIFNIKYFLTRNSKENIPFGFSSINSGKDDLYLYRNDYLLPFGYTYDLYADSTTIDNFIGIDRSWCYMDYAVVDNPKNFNISTKQTSSIKPTCYSIPTTTNIDSEGNIILTFNTLKNAEVYVKLSCLGTIGDQNLFITTKDSTSFFTVKNPNSNWYVHKDYEIFNVGYHKELSQITIKTEYPCHNIEVYYHPMDTYPEQIAELSKHHLENVKWETNKISGIISVPENRIMCLSLPKINGWSAFVDGKETEILTVNGMFMGLDIKPGNHTIEFKYFTPGLKLGLILSAFGLGALLFLLKKSYSK